MNLCHELFYTFRVMRKKLGFSLLSIVVVALGYGISIPLYSMVKNFAYAPLPFPDGNRIVLVSQINTRTNSDLTTSSFDFYQYKVIKESSTNFDSFGAFADENITFNNGDVSQQFFGGSISASALAITMTNPILGRLIQFSDEQPGADPVVLLGYDSWQNYYGADEDVVGQMARVNGIQRTIIGVMPPGFAYPQASQMWLPLFVPVAPEPGQGLKISLIGFLNEGVPRSMAGTELASIMQGLENEFPDNYTDRSARAIPLTHGIMSGAFSLFNPIAGLAISIFLLVALNIGNLLTIRANERVNELAIRAAVGASRMSLMLHVLLESFAICVSGAVIGSLLAKTALQAIDSLFNNLLPGGVGIPFWFDFGYTTDVVLVAAGMLVFLWLFSGSFAALRVISKDIAVTLSGDSKGMAAKASGRVTRGLVNVQVVLSFFLLLLSGVFVMEFQSSQVTAIVDDPDRYYSGEIILDTERYASEEARAAYRQQLGEGLLVNAEIESVTFSTSYPGDVGRRFNVSLEEDGQTDPVEGSRSGVTWVAENYFQTIDGLELSEGRYFDGADTGNTEDVVIVDDAFVRQMQLKESLVGKRVRISTGNTAETLARVVGVIPRFTKENIDIPEDATPLIYRPMTQDAPNRFQFIVKTRVDSQISVADVENISRLEATAVDRDTTFFIFDSLVNSIDRNNSINGLFASMFGAAALATLVLAIIGVYGLISRAVTGRTAEIGIRRAIGSSNGSIVGIFLLQGAFSFALAIILGGGVAVLAINIISGSTSGFHLLASLSIVFALVSVVVAGLIAYASYVPVRRVVAMEPGEALHHE